MNAQTPLEPNAGRLAPEEMARLTARITWLSVAEAMFRIRRPHGGDIGRTGRRPTDVRGPGSPDRDAFRRAFAQRKLSANRILRHYASWHWGR